MGEKGPRREGGSMMEVVEDSGTGKEERQEKEQEQVLPGGEIYRLGTASRGWLATGSILLGVYAFGPYDKTNGTLWQEVVATFVFVESVRLVAIGSIAVLWNQHRGSLPPRVTIEGFGMQTTSLVVSVYTLYNLFRSQVGFRFDEVPFLVPLSPSEGLDEEGADRFYGSERRHFQFMTVVLATYVVSDTVHRVRTWSLMKNWPMLIHHFVFLIVLGIGAHFPQLPHHYAIHAILFSAEASTPFLNLRWMMRWVAHYKGFFMMPVSLSFLILFVFSRFGLYLALLVYLWRECRNLSFPYHTQNMFCSAVASSYLLNLYWLNEIVQNVGGRSREKRE